MHYRPMIFFACTPCGGSASSTLSTTAEDPTESDEYPTLASGNALKLLGVAAGGTAQAFLSGSTLPGFVWLNDEGVAEVETEPELTLPAATSSAFSKLLVGTADSPSKWQMFAAPGSGSFMLAAVNGSWQAQNIGDLPGFSTLGESGPTATPLVLIGIRETSPGAWESAKLTVANERVLVGDADGISVRSLPPTEYLVHAMANFTKLLAHTFEHLDDAGAIVSGGISLGTALTTNVLCIYNTATHKFYRAPARVAVETFEDSDVQVLESGGVEHGTGTVWRDITPHCHVTATFNYPNAYVSAFIRTHVTNNDPDPVANPPDYNVDFALYVDGVAWDVMGSPLIWDVKGAKDNTISAMLIGLTLGLHTIEIRARKGTVSLQQFHVIESRMSVLSIP